MERVFLSLGSNLGDRRKNLDQAVFRLSAIFVDTAVSHVYETDPQEIVDQPRFLNMVFAGSTAVGAVPLLRAIHQIEKDLGRDRERETPKGPRTIDIDVLLYGSEVRVAEPLVLPHPRMRERQFVLVPLTELVPDLRDPQTGEPYAEILMRLPSQGIYLA